MLIYINGPDTFLAKAAIDQIKDKYIAKNPTGTELVEIDGGNPSTGLRINWADLRAIPLFATSRLVIVRGLAELSASSQESLASFLTHLPETTVAVIYQAAPLKADHPLTSALAQANKVITATPLVGSALKTWLKKQAIAQQLSLDEAALEELIGAHGSNLWALSSELATRANAGQVTVTSTQKEVEAAPFALFNYVRSGNWTAAKLQLRREARLGKPAELIFGLLAAAIRKELRAGEAKKDITDLLIDLDFGLKTGLLDGDSALALLVSHLPKPARTRVQWEATWRETF